MNRVGHAGRGESVWLGWFLVTVLNDFAPICDRRGRSDLAQTIGRGAMVDRHAGTGVDGDWYRRAYFDDGTPLGIGAERRVQARFADAIVGRSFQGPAQRRRAERAMNAVRAHLVRRDAQIVLLLTPPFDRMTHDPGYIKGYVPGVRENGGQYTHAAIWTVIALARLGMGDEAMELFHMINPINHMRTPEGTSDTARNRTSWRPTSTRIRCTSGRGGWTWYTGSRDGCTRPPSVRSSDSGGTAPP
jgi:cellobiose phosphorylase